MNITILVDNRPGHDQCTTEHGLSMYIKHDETELIFDLGQTDACLKNAQTLGIDLEQIKTVVLSHGHYDHTGGLVNIKGKRIILHPNCFTPRFGKIKKTYAGMPITKEELAKNNELFETETPYAITPKILFLTSIPRINDFEGNNSPTMLADGQNDELQDDSAIVFTTEKGLVIVAGCSHSGICNIIEYAKKTTGIDKIHAVVGGFHLREIDENLDKVIAYFKTLDVNYMLTGHCTCDEACVVLDKELGDSCHFEVLGAGRTYIL
jgi:7,8-dihydropterin-6-yl-methyl-4-(beta-D-ribofuranosyl)aminobenzene 5'-phosphate synthase